MFTRLATFKPGGDTGIIIELVGGRRAEISQAALGTLETPAAILAEAERQAGRTLGIFFHVNRDGSVALATGREPEVWPEDEGE